MTNSSPDFKKGFKETPYNRRGLRSPSQWKRHMKKPPLHSFYQEKPVFCIRCPKCSQKVSLRCNHCEHGAIERNPINYDELICTKCFHITSSIYCTCGFKFSTPYLQKKLKMITQTLRDGDHREYIAILICVVSYLAIVWGVVSLGTFLNYP